MKKYVECLECGEKFYLVSHKHLKKHGLTTKEYLIKYPNAELRSEYSRNKTSIANKGNSKCAWNKGLTTKTDMRLFNIGRKLSVVLTKKFNNGELTPWNKGLTKETDIRVANIAKKGTGWTHSKETIELIRQASIKHWQNDEYRKKVIANATIGIRESYASGKRKKPINYGTKPELRVEEILKEMNLKYMTQYPIWASYPRTYKFVRFYDFYIPSLQKIIEVQGDYWHAKDYFLGLKTYEELDHIQQETVCNDSLKKIISLNNHIDISYIWEFETKDKNILRERINKVLYSCTTPIIKIPINLKLKSIKYKLNEKISKILGPINKLAT